ncbi:MAG: vWA domain-containing protein [Deltaproteobacteria bacterium]|nr:vWA domain-containing protein [Deltaproteobacteria bacterium]
MSALSQIDLCFAIDCTNSMGPFIAAAQQQAQHILNTLADQSQADLRVAVVGYRDHGHDGELCDVFAFQPMSERARVSAALHGLTAYCNGNTDGAEAVFSGLVAALGLGWREQSMRVIVLVGDAPPHGQGANQEPFPDRYETDPTGRTLQSLTNEIESSGVTLYALGMIPSGHTQYDQLTRATFTFLARGTGGLFAPATNSEGALKVLKTIGERAFGDLVIDRRVFELMEDLDMVPPASSSPGMPAAPAPAAMASVAAQLSMPEPEVKRAIERLQKRKILE